MTKFSITIKKTQCTGCIPAGDIAPVEYGPVMWVGVKLAPFSMGVAGPADVVVHLLWILGCSVGLIWPKGAFGRGVELKRAV